MPRTISAAARAVGVGHGREARDRGRPRASGTYFWWWTSTVSSTSRGQRRNSAGIVPDHDRRELDEVAPLRHQAVVVAPGSRRSAASCPRGCAPRARAGRARTKCLAAPRRRSAKRRARAIGRPGLAAGQEAMAVACASPLSHDRAPFAPVRPARRSRTARPAPSSSATSQRIGRPNGNAPLPSSSQASQLMRLGKASRAAARRSPPGSTSRGRAAGASSSRGAGRARPARPGPWRACWRSSGRTPLFFANPCAAPVHAPGGVLRDLERRTPDLLLAVRLARASTSPRTTSRRGVENGRDACGLQVLARRPAPSKRWRSCSVRPGSQDAGISSKPISSRNSGTRGPARAVRRVGADVSRGDRAGQLADAQDHPRALADRDGPARVEDVEGVRRLQAPVVGGAGRVRPPGASGRASPPSGAVEEPPVQVDVGQLEGVARELVLLLLAHARRTARRAPTQPYTSSTSCRYMAMRSRP